MTKLPQNAPGCSELLQKALDREDDLMSILPKVRQPTIGGKYLHYSELLRRSPPKGLTHEQWWMGICLQRNHSTCVPLRPHSVANESFGFLLSPPLPERLHRIDLQAGGPLGLREGEAITNPQTKDQYYVSSLIEEAIHSSFIEGATTTRKKAKDMLRTKRAPQTRSEQMIFNNYQTMKRIGELREHELTPELVFEIHALVSQDTLDDPSASGRFRHDHEDIGVWHDEVLLWTPPAAKQLPSRLQAMCDFAMSKTSSETSQQNTEVNEVEFVHPVVRAIVLHFWLAYDHPFVDGNGRTARALFYWAMLHAGYWLFEFISISPTILQSPAQYRDAFLYSEDTLDLTYFLVYHLNVIDQALEKLNRYIARKQGEQLHLDTMLKNKSALNHRQRALLSHALRHPLTRYTIDRHKRSHGVVYETARRDLMGLEQRGFLIKETEGKTLIFSSPNDLSRKLKL